MPHSLLLFQKNQEWWRLRIFYPMSLVSGMYKILYKVLASRLSMVLDNIISKPQNTFIRGRQIFDSVLIANECLESCTKLGVPGLLCKLDMKRTYDRAKWDFFCYTCLRGVDLEGDAAIGSNFVYPLYASPFW